MSELRDYSVGRTTVSSSGVRVTTYMPTVRHDPATPQTVAKKRVCAYARVSTDMEEQLSSYAAQVDYYTRYIQSNPEWINMGIYSDEGISATSTAKREGFKQMIADAMDGKFEIK